MNHNRKFQSHITSKLGFSDAAPVLSTPYFNIDDAMDAAPARAAVWLNRDEALYQFTALADTVCEPRHLCELALGVNAVTDLVLVAVNWGDGWMWYEG